MSLAQLKSDELRRAAQDALKGSFVRFEQMLAFHSGLPGPRPNFALAETVGAALAGERAADRIIKRLADNIAAPDTAEVFLPAVAAHAYAARAAHGDASAWDALEELCADERGPVRAGTENALLILARQTGVAGGSGGDGIVGALTRWLDDDDRDRRWGAAATVLDALATDRAMERLNDRQALLDAVTALIADVADAPRAAERSEGRRRLLSALGRIAAAIASGFRAEPDGGAWLTERMSEAHHPDVRKAFDDALARLKKRGGAEKTVTLEAMHAALASSAKPDRHAARRREDMTSRGKKKKARG